MRGGGPHLGPGPDGPAVACNSPPPKAGRSTPCSGMRTHPGAGGWAQRRFADQVWSLVAYLLAPGNAVGGCDDVPDPGLY